MANKSAVFAASLAYTNAFNQAASLAPPLSVTAPYAGVSDGRWDLTALQASDSALTVPLGGVAVPSGLLVRNDSDADVELKINDATGSVSGTISSGGTLTLALASVTGEHLSVERVTSHGTAGVLSVRRSGGNVIIESWLAGTGLQVLDLSDVTVIQRTGAFTLPPGSMFSFFSPVVATPTSPIVNVKLRTEEATTLAGSVGYFVVGDPV